MKSDAHHQRIKHSRKQEKTFSLQCSRVKLRATKLFMIIFEVASLEKGPFYYGFVFQLNKYFVYVVLSG